MAKAPSDSQGRRRGRAQPIAALLPAVGAMAFRRFGFTQGELVAHWPEIVGPVYARWSLPDALRFARGQRDRGTLIIRVEGSFALQLQHVAPMIVARANRMLGYPAVARIRLVHGEVPRPQSARLPETAPNVMPLADGELRAALEALAERLQAGPGPVPRVR